MCQISCKSNAYNIYPIGFKMCLILHTRGITHNALLSLFNALDVLGFIADHTGRTATLIPKFWQLILRQFWAMFPILQSFFPQQIQFLRYLSFVYFKSLCKKAIGPRKKKTIFVLDGLDILTSSKLILITDSMSATCFPHAALKVSAIILVEYSQTVY